MFCGINPGRVSAAARAPFANPQNDFWRLLHAARFTPRLLEPSEFRELLAFGIGLTNAARRTTRGSSDLRAADFAGSRERLEASQPSSSRAASRSSARPRTRACFVNAPFTGCRSEGSAPRCSSSFPRPHQRTPPSRGTSGSAGFVRFASWWARGGRRTSRARRPSHCRSCRASRRSRARRSPTRDARARPACPPRPEGTGLRPR